MKQNHNRNGYLQMQICFPHACFGWCCDRLLATHLQQIAHWDSDEHTSEAGFGSDFAMNSPLGGERAAGRCLDGDTGVVCVLLSNGKATPVYPGSFVRQLHQLTLMAEQVELGEDTLPVIFQAAVDQHGRLSSLSALSDEFKVNNRIFSLAYVPFPLETSRHGH